MLQHDNAPAHCGRRVQDFLHRTCTRVLIHPPYSPDLAPSDYWLFDRIKRNMRGEIFSTLQEVQQWVETILGTIPPREFNATMCHLTGRWQKCVAAQGDYFE